MAKLIKGELYWIQVSNEFEIEPGRYTEDSLDCGPKFEVLGHELPVYPVIWVGDRIIPQIKQLKQCAGACNYSGNKCITCKWFTTSPIDVTVNHNICILIKPYWSQWEHK